MRDLEAIFCRPVIFTCEYHKCKKVGTNPKKYPKKFWEVAIPCVSKDKF